MTLLNIQSLNMRPWKLRNTEFNWGSRTYIMGVLNVTPDSFSDGGEFNSLNTAIEQAVAMVNAGVDIIDIGGESTRPGSEAVAQAEEINRVVPVIAAIRQHPEISEVPISIDTTKSAVARAAVAAGADVINDISGATFDAEMLDTIAHANVPSILMHIRGNPKNMQQLTDYDDLMREIIDFLKERIAAAVDAGCDRELISIDPGIGFAKSFEQNLELLRRLREFEVLEAPILMGVSRKSFIGHILNQPEAKERVWGTAAACTVSIANGADILRVHDVAEIRDVARVADAIYRV